MKNYEEYLEDLEETENRYFLQLEKEEEETRKDLLKYLNEKGLAHYNRNNIKKYVESINYNGIATEEEINYYFSLL